MTKSTRDPLFDMVRFVAMFMVVYSHVMFYRPGFNIEIMPSRAMNFIVVICMPLFFIVSGYFSRHLHESGNWRKLANRLIKYFWPIVIISFLLSIWECFGEQMYSISEVPLRAMKKFLFSHWFFFVLALCDVITFLVYKYGRTIRTKVLLAMAAFGICLAATGRIWHAMHAVAMMPFYWFGIVFLSTILSRRRLFVSIACLGVVAILISTFVVDNVATSGLGFYWDYFDVWNPSSGQALNMLLRYVVGIIGAIFIFYFIKLIVGKFAIVASLAPLGAETLGIYLLQGTIIKYLSNRLVSLDASTLMLLVDSIAVFFLSFCIVRALKWNTVVRILVFGKEFAPVSKGM